MSDELARLAQEGGPTGQLLQQARADLPSPEQLSALSARLEQSLGEAAQTTASATGSAGGGLGAKLGGVLLLLGGGGGLLWWSSSQTESAQPIVAREAAVAPASVPAPPPRSEPVTEVTTATASAVSAGDVSDEQTRESGSKVAAKPSPRPTEVAILEQARRALKSNPSRALALTRQHRNLYPQGMLAQEREVIAIEALKNLKRDQEAKARAGEFEEKHGGSAHGKKIESVLDGGS